MIELLPPPDIDWLEDRQELMAKAMAASRFGIDLYYQRTIRSEICGRASYFILRQLEAAGHDAEMVHAFSDDPVAQRYDLDTHVIVRAQTDEGEVYIDGSYSQFFKPFGLVPGLIDKIDMPSDDTKINRHELTRQLNSFVPGYNPFPSEKVIVFTPDMVEGLAKWAADVTKIFWQNHAFTPVFQESRRYTSDRTPQAAFESIFKPKVGISQDELEEYFSSIWDINRYEPYDFVPSEEEEAVEWYEDVAITLRHYEATGVWVSPQELRPR